MPMPSPDPASIDAAGWQLAHRALAAFLRAPGKVDTLFEALAGELTGPRRRRAQGLLFGAVRHLRLLEAALSALAPRNPRLELRALLLLAGAEILERGAAQAPLIGDHAVRRARGLFSAREAGFVNALVRRFPAALSAAATTPALRHSHPDWLAKRWRGQFGTDESAQLMAWNQEPPVVTVVCQTAVSPLPAFLAPTRWEGVYRYVGSDWVAFTAWLQGQGLNAQVRDPSTQHPLDLLAANPGETVLDLCAAPGGKSRAIASALGGSGQLVALDLPGNRSVRLTRGLEGTGATVVARDLRETAPPDLATLGLPPLFDAVLIDAPCSNTGVLRRRPDAKGRLRESSIAAMAVLQRELLARAAAFVRPGGRLIYSTCSMEPEENRAVVDALLLGDVNFRLEETRTYTPLTHGHDGGSAFCLRRD